MGSSVVEGSHSLKSNSRIFGHAAQMSAGERMNLICRNIKVRKGVYDDSGNQLSSRSDSVEATFSSFPGAQSILDSGEV